MTSSSKLRSVLTSAEYWWDRRRRRWKLQLGWMSPLRVEPYRTYGTERSLWLRGRVLEDKNLGEAREDASLWRNLRDAFHRYESDEIPGARVEITLGDRREVVTTNDEGFFDLVLEDPPGVDPEAPWTRLPVRLVEPLVDDQEPHESEAFVRLAGPEARFGVVSDMDDTVIRTGATDFLKRLRVELLENASSRRPFPGVSPFYRALSDDEVNPFFYVSSSPWNLFGLFEDFLRIHDIPPGPILLKDMGLTEKRWLKGGHDDYKGERIGRVLDTYPDLPFILVGDSGQRDAFIYEKVVDEYPERILAIYIRDVSDDARGTEIQRVAERLEDAGVDLLLMADTTVAAEHAAEREWIDGAAVDRVRSEVGA